MAEAVSDQAGTGALAAPLVERDREVAALAAALDSAAGGSGRVILVEGEAGSGKTRLVAESARLAEARGMTRLGARGAELEQSFPFGVIRQLLERPLTELDADEGEAILGGVATPVRSVLRDAAPPEQPPRDVLFALVHGTYWAFVRLAERAPLAVLVDDLHWADDPSIRALAYLGHRLDELPVALVLSVRIGEGVPAATPHDLVGGSAAATPISLSALSEPATATLLDNLLGSTEPAFSSAVYRSTRGNPFLVRELASAAASGQIETDAAGAERVSRLAPGSVASWTLGRLDRLSPSARTLADSLAVLERSELRVAAAHAELSDPDARAAADRLAEAGLVERGLPLRFAHPIVRRALYDQLSPAAREQGHHRAARLLCERGAAPEQIAPHLLQCEPRGDNWAVEALRDAAAQAVSRGAAEQGVKTLKRAISEPRRGADDPELLLELGRAQLALNDAGAIDTLARATQVADGPTVRAAVLGALGHARYLGGDGPGAFEAVSEALDVIPPGRGGSTEAELLLSYLLAGRQVPELLDLMRSRMAEPRLAAEGEPSPAEVVRRHIRGLDSYMRGERAAAATDARWVAARLRDPSMVEVLPSLLATGPPFVLAGLGEYGEAEGLIDRALDRATQRGSRLETAEALHDRVWARWRRGDIRRGLADAETIFGLTDGAWEIAKVPLRVAAADMLVERGDQPQAAAQLDAAGELEARLQGTWGWTWLPYGRARLALARADWRAAREAALAAGARFLAIEASSPEYCPWRTLAARAAAELGQRDRALELSREQLKLAREIGSPRAAGMALSALGAIEGGKPGVEMLEEAVGELDLAGAELERGRARIELGVVLRRARRVRDARGPLREALDIARRIGATGLAKHAHAELQAAGGRPRRERTTGVESLTARERQTAELAASGLTNPEIAQRLFITRKTVEAHMRSVFRKLDVRRRDELTGALATTLDA